MKFLLKALIITNLLLFVHLNVYATINLSNYTLAAPPTTITQIPDDLSGLTYNASTNTLFACLNSTPTVYELDLNGNVLRTINLTGFEDTEGLVWIGGTDFIIIEERRGRAVRITITATTTAIAYPMAFMQLPGTWGNNLGLEGVSYNPATNELVIIKEKSPLTIYSFVPPASYNGAVTVTNPFNIATNNFGFSDIAGLHHLGLNTYMPCGVDVSNNYLILSHESAALIETDDTGTEYSRLDLSAGGANGTLAATLPQAEGVTMDNQGNIYVVSEPNIFYKFSDEIGCCATVDLDIRFDGFPAQTSWNITDASGNVVASSGSYSGTSGNSSLTENTCLFDGCYTLNFMDALNNGMCPFRATASSLGTFITPGTLITPGSVVATLGTVVSPGLCGNYALYDANGAVLASGGGGFGASEANTFCLSGGVIQRLSHENKIYPKATNLQQMRIIPNIVNDQTTLFYSLETNKDIQIQIMDITGKMVQQYARNFDDRNEVHLNVNHLQSGVYFVQIMSGDVVMIEKFVKR